MTANMQKKGEFLVMTEFKRAGQWLKSFFSSPVHDATSGHPVAAFDLDPSWHGDHWQNLLSSPIDARHYIMENWTLPPEHDFGERRAMDDAQPGAA